LQAADILLYHANFVPVGADQVQHLELTNTIVKKFNNKFGQTFKEIKPYIKNPLRIMSLTKPERKMSKSEPDSTINIFDEPDAIKKKLAKAVTATDAPAGEMPQGVGNLFELGRQFGNHGMVEKFEKQYHGGSIKYSELKTELAQALADFFAPMRAKKKELEQDHAYVKQVLQDGAAAAASVANQTLADAKKKIGLI
jgi:tryptophanyl-tRNA synthetase